MHTACARRRASGAPADQCGRKNYRLQDIQLSKNWFFRAHHRPSRKNLASFSRALKISHVEKFQPEKNSGEYRARTGDLLVANQALSQLS
jgi:hypothetical protein